MILLTSNGLTSEALLRDAARALRPESKKAALVTTASVGYKNKDWNVPRHTAALESLGLQVSCYDVEFEDGEALLGFDVIFLMGGNPFCLLKHLRPLKPELERFLASDGLLVGCSAGSIVLGTTLELIAAFDPQMNDAAGLNDFTGLGFTQIDICPHYTRYAAKYDRFAERVAAFEDESGIRLIRLDDTEGIFVPWPLHT